MRHVRLGLSQVLGAIAVLAQLVACGDAPRLDVVVLVIDTLRADRVGVYGSDAGLTPTIDALAATGAVFERAYAQSSWTNPSVASLLTSRYQSQHGITNVMTILPESESTLAEVFWLNGYLTAGFSANTGIAHERGFGQGYTNYVVYQPEYGDDGPFDAVPARAAVLNQGALEWLDAQPRSKPVFMWLQYMEPHFPYVLPEPLAELDGAPCPDPVKAKMSDPDGPAPAPEVMRAVELCYDASVKAADTAVAALVGELRRRGRLEHTIIAITSDHGEELREHGRVGHGYTLYDEVIRVPLVIALPWNTHGLTVSKVVRLIDLAPTLLELAGIRPPKSFEGRSFAELMPPPLGWWQRLRARVWQSDPPPVVDGGPDGALSELLSAAGARRPQRDQHLMALVDDDRKLIVSKGDPPRAFFDLTADPTEQGTGLALDAGARETLERILAATLERASRNPAKPVDRTMDPDTRRQLEALGYVE